MHAHFTLACTFHSRVFICMFQQRECYTSLHSLYVIKTEANAHYTSRKISLFFFSADPGINFFQKLKRCTPVRHPVNGTSVECGVCQSPVKGRWSESWFCCSRRQRLSICDVKNCTIVTTYFHIFVSTCPSECIVTHILCDMVDVNLIALLDRDDHSGVTHLL